MKTIQAFPIWDNGQTLEAKVIDTYSINVTLGVSANFYYALYSETTEGNLGQMLRQGYYADLDANGESDEFEIWTGGGNMNGSLFIIMRECINPNTQQPYRITLSPYDMLQQQL